MAANATNPTGSQIEIQRVEKAHEASYLENIQGQGYEHLGEPLQIEFNRSIDDIRNWVLTQAMGMNATLISEVENPPAAEGQTPIIVYYIWRATQAQMPAVEPQAYSCPYCTQPFMAVPGPDQQVVACPNCGGANIIPASEVPEPLPAPAPSPEPAHKPTPTPEPAPETAPEASLTTPPAQLDETPEEPQKQPQPQPQTQTQPQAPTPAQQIKQPKQEPEPTSSSTTAPAAPAAPTTTTAPAAPTAPTASAAPAAPTAPAPSATAAQNEATQTQTPAQSQSSENTTTGTEANTESTDYQDDQYEQYQRRATQEYSTEMPSFDYFTKKVESDTNKPKTPLLTPEYEQSYNANFQTIEQAIKMNMQKLADLLANPKNTVKFYDSGELMYPKVTIRKSAYTHLGTREMDLMLIKDGVNDYKIISNETHSTTGGGVTPMQDELFALKTLGHASYRAMEDWAYLDSEQKTAVSKCVYAFTDIYYKKLPKEVEE